MRAVGRDNSQSMAPMMTARPEISAVRDSLGLLLMGLGQESDREGEMVS